MQVQDEVHPETGGRDQERDNHDNKEEKNKLEQRDGKNGGSQDGEGEEGFHGFPQSPETRDDAPEYLAVSRESSTRELVLAAITVMKGRKARPDTRRLCNWVHRKYGRPVQVQSHSSTFICTHMYIYLSHTAQWVSHQTSLFHTDLDFVAGSCAGD